jgi:integrase
MHEKQFETITMGWALLSKHAPTQPSEKSIGTYQRELNRIKARTEGGRIWDAAAQTTSQRTWYLRRAAILFHAWQALARQLAVQEQVQSSLSDVPSQDARWDQWRTEVEKVGRLIELIKSAPSGSPLVDPKPRRTKRKTGPGLPDDWREQLAARLPNWRQAYLVAAVTGCRPAELAKGVELIIREGQLLASIIGAKVGEHAGQPLRSMRWTLPNASPLVEQLAEAVLANAGALTVSLGNRNTNPARAFSDAIREAAKRAWPGRKLSITAYSLRHAAASDLKSSGLGETAVSQALGHASLSTKSTYGRARTQRGVSVAPGQVEGSRPVRGEASTWLAARQPPTPQPSEH